MLKSPYALTPGGEQTITLTGDVTGSGTGSFAATIAADAVTTAKIINDAVTYAKMQNISATDRVLGRSTAGAGDAEEIICTAAGRAVIDDADAAAQRTTLGLGTIATQASSSVSISGGTVTGITDLVVADGGTGLSTATAYAVLCGGATGTGAFQSIAGLGTSGQVLTSNGAGALPTMQAAAGGIPNVILNTTAVAITLVAGDKGKLVELTGSTAREFAFTAAATLTDGWWCFLKNSSTAELTLNPNGAELIDGLSTYIMYPGEVRLVQCTGTAFNTLVTNGFSLIATATLTFTKPPGYTAFDIEGYGAGAGGGSGRRGATLTTRNGGGGGGGGAYNHVIIIASDVGATVTVTIGAGGAGGAAITTDSTDGNLGVLGGNSTFGSLATFYGGGRGGAGTTTGGTGGGGGGIMGAGGTAGGPGAPSSDGGGAVLGEFGGGSGGIAGSSNGRPSAWGGGGGGATALFSTGGPSGNGGPGGGGGGRITSGDVAGSGGAGGGNTGMDGGGGAGGSTGVAGTAGTARNGGGGGGSHDTTAGAGGAGGAPAGGGGGGGASLNGANSGAGAAGARGEMRIRGVV